MQPELIPCYHVFCAFGKELSVWRTKLVNKIEIKLRLAGMKVQPKLLREKEEESARLFDFLSQRLPRDFRLVENDPDFRRDFYRAMGVCGIMGMAGPKPYGSAFSSRQMVSVFEQIAKNSVGLAISLAAHTLCVFIVGRWGTEAQKKRWLSGLCRGEKLGAFCLTEAKTGSDAKSLRMKAIPLAGGYLLKGTKTLVTNGGEASAHIILARVTQPDEEKEGSEGITAFVVDASMPNMTIKPYRERKVGFGAFPIAALGFKECPVTEEHRLGKEGDGLRQAMKALEVGKVNMGAIAIGLAESAYQAAVAHARRRKQFGRQIADFQAVQFLLVDMYAKIKTARLLVEDAAETLDSGKASGYESALAKCYATDMAMQVVTDSAQVLGGAGLLVHPLERNLWEAKLLQILEGTNQIQRLIVARALLGANRKKS